MKKKKEWRAFRSFKKKFVENHPVITFFDKKTRIKFKEIANLNPHLKSSKKKCLVFRIHYK